MFVITESHGTGSPVNRRPVFPSQSKIEKSEQLKGEGPSGHLAYLSNGNQKEIDESLTNGKQSETSLPNRLKNIKAPKFVKDLVSMKTVDGQRLTFECRVEGEPYPSITWCFNGDPIDVESRDFKMSQDVDGHARLEIVEVFPEDEGCYSCTAVNEAGTATTSATLTVIDEHAPKFTIPLKPDIEAVEGDEVCMECSFIGHPLPTIEWFKGAQSLKSSKDFKIVTDKTSGTSKLLIKETFPEDKGTFRCVASNSGGQDETSTVLKIFEEETETEESDDAADDIIAPLNGQIISIAPKTIDTSDKELECGESDLIEPVQVFNKTNVLNAEVKETTNNFSKPKFTQELASKTVASGEPLVMSVTIESSPEVKFIWRFNDKEIQSSRDVQVTSFENKSILSISEVFEDDAGYYSCTAENIMGSAVTSANLSVEELEIRNLEPPTFAFHLMPFDVMDGEEVRFTAIVTGNPMPEVTWYHNGREVRENKDVHIKMTDKGQCELYISEIFPEDAGSYICKAVNDVGEAISQADLVVEAYEYIPDSEIASISANATTTSGTAQSTQEGDSTAPSSTSETDEDELRRSASTVSPLQSESDDQSIIVPKFVTKLTSIKAAIGNEVTFHCNIEGKPTPIVCWYKNGDIIRRCKGTAISFDKKTGTCTLTIAEVSPDDYGEYLCEAKSRGGVDITTTVLSESS